jgi:hypothetical protein
LAKNLVLNKIKMCIQYKLCYLALDDPKSSINWKLTKRRSITFHISTNSTSFSIRLYIHHIMYVVMKVEE